MRAEGLTAARSETTELANGASATSPTECSRLFFGSNCKFPGGEGAQATVTADLDGDGDQDVAIANKSTRSVSVMLNCGNGSINKHATIPLKIEPTSIAVGDLNGDARPDLVAAGGQVVVVALNRGDATFVPPVVYDIGHYAFAVVVGDVDSDGYPDVLASGYWRVSRMLGGGDGTLGNPLVCFTGIGFFLHPVLGDLDGDGGLDLALAEDSSGRVLILLNNRDGTYAEPVIHSVASHPTSIAVGDLDGDGRPDLATGHRQNGKVSLLMNWINRRFQRRHILSLSQYPVTWAVAIGDLDRQGPNDLVAINGRDLVVLRNFRNAAFTIEGRHYIHGGYDFAIADMDGDGVSDLAVASGGTDGTSVLLNQGDGSFAERTYDIPGSRTRIALGDLDGNGSLDLVVPDGRSAIALAFNAGDGTFGEVAEYACGVYPESVATADVNGDGWLDVGVANAGSDNVTLFLNHGGGTFGEPNVIPTGEWPSFLAFGDVNGDAVVDLVVTNAVGDDLSVRFGHGNGTFGEEQVYGAGDAPSFVALVELDRNPGLDIAVTGTFSGDVSIYRNKGDGTFTEPIAYAVGSWPWSLSAGDLNGDGHSDLAVANSGGDYISILLNQGNGTFNKHEEYTIGDWVGSVLIRDLDADGHGDLAVTSFGSDGVTILLNRGDGTFERRMTSVAGSDPWATAIGDLDNDGLTDLAVANWDDIVYVLLNRSGTDCNDNGLADQCDLRCGTDRGVCDVAGCGGSDDCNDNRVPDECDVADGTSTDHDGDGRPDECSIVASLHIKPGACPNSINPRNRGLVPVALAGMETFDVGEVDFDSVELRRADGTGEVVAIAARGRHLMAHMADVTAPREGAGCECQESHPDGLIDLVLHFSAEEMTDTFGLDALGPGESLELALTGRLLDGTYFRATDCVTIPGSKAEGEMGRSIR